MAKYFLFSTLLFVLQLSAFASNSTPIEEALPYIGSQKIDVQSYDIRINVPNLKKLESGKKKIYISSEVRVNMLEETKSFGLHYSKDAIELIDITTSKRGVKASLIDGKTVEEHFLDGGIIKFSSKKKLKIGESIIINMKYSIKHESLSNDRGFIYSPKFNGSRILNVRSWPYYTRNWLPSNDTPNDVAKFSYTLNVPANLTAVANGKFLSLKKNHSRWEYKYGEEAAFPTYATNLAIGDFDITKSQTCYSTESVSNEELPCEWAPHAIDLEYYSPLANSTSGKFKEKIYEASKSLIFFSSLLGNYNFDSLRFVTAAHPFNMESISLITLVSPSAAIHEVVHQWIGNTLYFKHWGDFWISEGITTYLTGFYGEYFTGTFSKEACLLEDLSPEEQEAPLNNPADTDPLTIFNQVPYCKGSGAIHDLRYKIMELIGLNPVTRQAQDIFLNIFKNFYLNFKFQKIDSSDIVNYFQSTLDKTLEDQGYADISQVQIDVLMKTWKDEWLSN